MAALSTCHAFGQGLVNFAPTSTLLPLRPAPTTSASRAPGARLHAYRTVGGCVSATSRAAYGPAAVRRLGTQRAKATRVAATSDRPRRVALLGAGGGIGQPLALLLKLHPLVSHLALFDVVSVEGVHADLSHINTLAETSAHTGKENLKDALKGAEVVIIPAGLPRKPGMTRDDLFSINAGIVRDLVEACAEAAPGAMLCVITNPVNSTVPVAAQVLKQARVFDPRRLFGVTLLDVVRAETFYARELGLPPGQVSVPVVGGHAGTTILPLFSQAVPPPHSPLSADRLEELTRHTQDAGTEVVEAKQGNGSATLSMAYAAERFCDALLRAMAGEPGVEICAYVASDAREGLEFFASKVLLGKDGVEKILPLGQLSEAEERQLREAESVLKSNIHAGLAAEVI